MDKGQIFEIQAAQKIQEFSVGLPLVASHLLLNLIPRVNFKTGKATISETLAKFVEKYFTPDPAPGRKAEKITPDTIRNAFRTIKKFRGDYFKFSTEGQRIVIEMPFIRELYEEHLKSQELAGEVAEAAALENTGLEGDQSTKSAEEVTAVSSPNNNFFINKKIKTTTQQQAELIADNFYPSDELIEKAKAQGYTKAEDCAEIQAFIDYNKARASKWVDFNPVYFRWLQRGFEHQQRHLAQQEYNEQRRANNECNAHRRSPKKQRFENVLERVIEANPESGRASNANIIEGHCKPVGGNDGTVWGAFCE